jgi:hypothetical protein
MGMRRGGEFRCLVPGLLNWKGNAALIERLGSADRSIARIRTGSGGANLIRAKEGGGGAVAAGLCSH